MDKKTLEIIIAHIDNYIKQYMTARSDSDGEVWLQYTFAIEALQNLKASIYKSYFESIDN